MSNTMLSATESARPIMEYVRELEVKVRHYRQLERRFQLRIFLVGCATGWAIATAAWVFLH